MKIWLVPFLIGAGLVSTLLWAETPRVRQNVELELEEVPGASLYEIQVHRKGQKDKPMRFKVENPKWAATIKPGTYSLQIRSYDDRGAPGDWSAPMDIQVLLPAIIVKSPEDKRKIESPDAKEQKVKLEWEPIPGARAYKLTMQNADGYKLEKEVDEPHWEGEVPVGQNYQWNVAALDRTGELGKTSDAPYQFSIEGPALAEPEIRKPISELVAEVDVQPPDHAKTLDYELARLDAKKKKWILVERKAINADEKIKMDVARPSGKYRLTVEAQGPLRKPSKKSRLVFNMKGGFREPAAFENAVLRDALTKPSRFYAIASYLITQMNYQGANYDSDSGSLPRFEALGGTGRIGAGYQEPYSNWGGFGIVDYSGFVIGGQNFKFASIEAHLTRKLELGQGGLLQFGTGLFSKELPIVLGSQSDGFSSVGKVRGTGPHAGFTYWMPLSGRIGLQANARMYYTLFGKSDTGANAGTAISYQYGLLGTYRLSRRWMGYAGYAYRLDEAQYASDDAGYNPGGFNTISIEGHYLNLMLEFSF
ncbi:MAG: hypothetical protein AB7F86_13385 [Bdellovibrionales bacterium]